MSLQIVIMAGGRGERLWPLSCPGRPKQLLSFDGEMSLLRATVERVLPLVAPGQIHVVTGEDISDAVRAELPAGVDLIAEPCGRNTAPCVAWAAARINARDPEAVMAVLPADHLIADEEQFRRSLRFGEQCLERYPRHLLTLGIVPGHPETGYGYIAPAADLVSDDGLVLREVERFVEKPDRERAEAYVAQGYLWNAGMFIWRVDTILDAFREHAPGMYALLEESGGHDDGLARFYAAAESISIDYAILEKARQVAVIPAEFGWDDIGSWDAVGDVYGGADGNALFGRTLVEDGRGNVAFSSGKQVVLLGVDDLVVVESEDAILVCPRNRSQDVSAIAKKMRGVE